MSRVPLKEGLDNAPSRQFPGTNPTAAKSDTHNLPRSMSTYCVRRRTYAVAARTAPRSRLLSSEFKSASAFSIRFRYRGFWLVSSSRRTRVRERFRLSLFRSNSSSSAGMCSSKGGRTCVAADSICDSTDLLSQPLAIPPLYGAESNGG